MGLRSTATVTSIGLACKLFLAIPGFANVSVTGLDILLDALRSDARKHGHGVITVANHISTLDDPVAWSVLPVHTYLRSRTTRWALGASDIMFTNPLFSAFFRQGQVLETFRGRGIYQPAVDAAIGKLNDGAWVHLFGEGKVNQPETYPIVDALARLPRFKWGVGRILMETARPPIVIPMWLSGFDQLMPEGRSFPYKYLPRLGARLSVTFGEPLPQSDIRRALESVSPTHGLSTEYTKPPVLPPEGERAAGWVGADATKGVPGAEAEEIRNAAVARVRSEVTAVLQRAVEDLGRRVSGDLLGASRK